MDGHRQAALALHGLPEPDRAWVLGQLNEAERTQVAHLLTELRDLGIPREPIAIPVPMTARDRVRAAKPARIRELLRKEPVDFVAAVLAIEAWPWRAAYLARLPRARRAAVESRIRAREQQPAADRLREALMDQIGVRLLFTPKSNLTPFSWLRARWTRR
jgi:hypothetical protein